MNKAIFIRTLQVPARGEKVHSLSNEEILAIKRRRGERDELDPGMGGVNPERLDEMLAGGSELASLDLAVTARCNYKCVHCYRPSNEWGSFSLPFNVIERTVQDAAELGVRYFVLTGGEPLLYKSVHDGVRKGYFDIVDAILSICGGDVKILTFDDVGLISAEKAKMFADRKVALSLKRDTLDQDVQNGILGKEYGITQGSQQIERGFSRLFDAGYGKNPKLAVSVNQVLRKGDFNTLDGTIDLHRWVRSNGMWHSIVPIHYCGEASNDNQTSGIHPLEIKALYDILAEIDGLEFKDPWTVYSPFPGNKTCNRPGRGLHVRSNGDVTSCSESPIVPDYVFGNILNTRLVDMVRSPKFQGFREEFSQREGKFICNPEVCDLNAENLCRGGCAARAAYSRIDPETGLMHQNEDMTSYSMGREDPFCPGWIVLAQKQGVLKPGVYEAVVDGLLEKSRLPDSMKSSIRERIVERFDALRLN